MSYLLSTLADQLVLANVIKDSVSWLIGPLDSLLRWFHDNVWHNWGLAIISMTVVVRLALLPLTYKQITSMIHMQQFQPQIKEINEKFKEDPQRKQQELMKFFKEHQINPLASCFPLLLQLPFFIAMFYALQDKALQNYMEATDPSFLFIDNLIDKPEGAALVVMLILYVGSQLGSTLVSLTPTTDDTQRKLMLALPFIFVPFVINFPAGLVLYWITTNFWTFGQSIAVRRLKAARAPVDGEDAKAATVGASENGAAAAAPASKKAPPPPPRQKKKRSGRRR
ncbi:MAG: membrane protein insertase YidC [Actinobacteria bacterium]|nr:membrane protein insertase YidC [Actinomycetota bacterium]